MFGLCEHVEVTTAERLKRAIERRFGKGTTQAKVAESLEVPPGSLSEWLNGQYEPTLSTLRHLSKGLGCSVATLAGDEAAS